jgi:hypothetical protein
VSDRLIDVRTPLASSEHARVEIGQDGVLHVLVGSVTLHLDQAVGEELTTTLARAMLALRRAERAERPQRPKRPTLELVRAALEAEGDIRERAAAVFEERQELP